MLEGNEIVLQQEIYRVIFYYENLAEYPTIYGGDECGAGVWGMQSPIRDFQEAPPFKAGGFTFVIGNSIKYIQCYRIFFNCGAGFQVPD